MPPMKSMLWLLPFTKLVVATTTVYMRIEGPTHTIYEERLQANTETILENNGHSTTCDGEPDSPAGVTPLIALDQTGQDFYTTWNGSAYGYIEHINGTTNNATYLGRILCHSPDDMCFKTIPQEQQMLYTFSDIEATPNILALSGPAIANVGDAVTYFTTYTEPGSWVDDLSTDVTDGQRVYAELVVDPDAGPGIWAANITFTEPGTYYMKAHCAPDTDGFCVRSQQVVTTVIQPITNINMRIEGPTHTIYEQVLNAVTETTLENNGYSATCDGVPSSSAGVTPLTALDQTGQYFYTAWNGSIYGYIEHINGTSNNATYQWNVAYNDLSVFDVGSIAFFEGTEYAELCFNTIPQEQDMLYAFANIDADPPNVLVLTGPATASVGDPVTYFSSSTSPGSWINDLSTDATLAGQRVYAELLEDTTSEDGIYMANITFTQAGTYNMKAHCAPSTVGYCVRSNQVVTVVS